MLFFICIIILFFIITFLIIISEFRIEVKNLNISSSAKNLLNNDYKIIIGLYINKVALIRFRLNKEKMKKIELKEKIQRIDFEKYVKNTKPRKEIIKKIKFLEINIKEVNLNVEIDTIDPIITTFVTTFISSILGIIFGIFIKKYDGDKQKFSVEPVYMNKNLINLRLSCIISVKIWNIIKESLKNKKLFFHDLKNTKAIQI